MTCTAKITARAAASCVPDNDLAVDADIYADGAYVCGVTLIDGDIWGSHVDQWCSDAAAAEKALGDDWKGRIVTAVNEAA